MILTNLFNVNILFLYIEYSLQIEEIKNERPLYLLLWYNGRSNEIRYPIFSLSSISSFYRSIDVFFCFLLLIYFSICGICSIWVPARYLSPFTWIRLFSLYDYVSYFHILLFYFDLSFFLYIFLFIFA